MSRFLDLYKPDIVIEINRSRNQISECDVKFHHVAWIQDYASQGVNIFQGYGGSAMNYSVHDPRMFDFKSHMGRIGVLLMAIDSEVFIPQNKSPAWDLSLIGYLALPLQEHEKTRVIESGGVKTTLGEIHAAYLKIGLNHNNFQSGVLDKFLFDFMKARKRDYVRDTNFHNVMALYSDRLSRAGSRQPLLYKILEVTKNVRFYGVGHWHEDKKLSRHFYGPVETVVEKIAVNANSRIVFHNGNMAVHERMLEAMAMGCPVMLNHTPYEDGPHGIGRFFDPDNDFVFYDENNIRDVTKELLANKEKRKRMAARTRKRILAGHTWKHRAEQILRDYNDH